MEEKRFSIYQSMKCGSYEAEIRKYKLFVGKSGKRWLIAVQPNEADNIYVEGGKNSDGFGGRILNFTLEDNKVISLKAPWHSNPDSLFRDTGYDIRNKHFTKGIIALNREHDYLKGDLYSDIIFEDKDWILEEFDRIEKKAQELANKLNKIVYYGVISNGGGCSSQKEPTILRKKNDM